MDYSLRSVTGCPGRLTLGGLHPNGGMYQDFYAGPIYEDCDFVAEFYRLYWTVVTTSPSVEITDLPEGKTFRCDSVATSAAGNSPKSNVVEFKTRTPSKPSQPIITATDYGDEELYLKISVNDDGGQPVTRYDAICTGGGRTYTGSSTNSSNTVSGLTNETPYTCTVTATNSVGTSSSSTASLPITPEWTQTGLPIWLLYEASK